MVAHTVPCCAVHNVLYLLKRATCYARAQMISLTSNEQSKPKHVGSKRCALAVCVNTASPTGSYLSNTVHSLNSSATDACSGLDIGLSHCLCKGGGGTSTALTRSIHRAASYSPQRQHVSPQGRQQPLHHAHTNNSCIAHARTRPHTHTVRAGMHTQIAQGTQAATACCDVHDGGLSRSRTAAPVSSGVQNSNYKTSHLILLLQCDDAVER